MEEPARKPPESIVVHTRLAHEDIDRIEDLRGKFQEQFPGVSFSRSDVVRHALRKMHEQYYPTPPTEPSDG